MNFRTCIIAKQTYEKHELIRFVPSPNREIVPDLKQNLPGRGAYILAKKTIIEKAIKNSALVKYFKSKLKEEFYIDNNMPALVESLLIKHAIGSIALGRKAGIVISGALACDKAIRSGNTKLILHTKGASANGITKLNQAIHASKNSVQELSIFSKDELEKAFGMINVQHIAILASPLAKNILTNLEKLHIYRE